MWSSRFAARLCCCPARACRRLATSSIIGSCHRLDTPGRHLADLAHVDGRCRYRRFRRQPDRRLRRFRPLRTGGDRWHRRCARRFRHGRPRSFDGRLVRPFDLGVRTAPRVRLFSRLSAKHGRRPRASSPSATGSSTRPRKPGVEARSQGCEPAKLSAEISFAARWNGRRVVGAGDAPYDRRRVRQRGPRCRRRRRHGPAGHRRD